MITSGGGPGVWGLLHALRRLPGRPATLLVSDPDMNPTLGTACADEAVRLPPACAPDYLATLLRVCRVRRVDVLVPVYDGELLAIAQNVREFLVLGSRVLIPPADVVARCVDKARTHELLAATDLLPRHALVRTIAETDAAIAALGYPQRRLCVRPTNLAGSRGFQLLDAQRDLFAEQMLSKPGVRSCTAEEFSTVRRAGPVIFPLIVSEYLEGEELGIDLLADQGRVVEMMIRRKGGPQIHGNWTQIRFGELPGERAWVARVAAALQLDGLVCIDARYRTVAPVMPMHDRIDDLFLLEVNPRPGAYIGVTCTRLHLLAWAIDRLMTRVSRRRAEYEPRGRADGDEIALRAFADLVVSGGRAVPLAIDHPIAEFSEEHADARAVPCSTSG